MVKKQPTKDTEEDSNDSATPANVVPVLAIGRYTMILCHIYAAVVRCQLLDVVSATHRCS